MLERIYISLFYLSTHINKIYFSRYEKYEIETSCIKYRERRKQQLIQKLKIKNVQREKKTTALTKLIIFK